MKKGFYCLLVSAFLSVQISQACDQFGQTGILPENNMRISTLSLMSNGMTEKRFNEIIDEVVTVYAPIVQQKGGSLLVNRLWTTDVVNASAERKGSSWIVNMYGGLARHMALTEDGLMLVVCHELGHHIGGAPKYGSDDWAADEGQADYFGSMKCLRRVMDKKNFMPSIQMEIDKTAQEKCDDTFPDGQDRAICGRVAMAGKSLANLFASFGGSAPQFNNPDQTVVNSTFHSHPQAQCRLDTYFQGTLCTKSYLDDVSFTDSKTGVCIKADGFKSGERPLCWYKPLPDET